MFRPLFSSPTPAPRQVASVPQALPRCVLGVEGNLCWAAPLASCARKDILARSGGPVRSLAGGAARGGAAARNARGAGCRAAQAGCSESHCHTSLSHLTTRVLRSLTRPPTTRRARAPPAPPCRCPPVRARLAPKRFAVAVLPTPDAEAGSSGGTPTVTLLACLVQPRRLARGRATAGPKLTPPPAKQGWPAMH